MKKLSIISVCILLLVQLGCAKKVLAVPGEVKATAFAPAIPVLKGVEQNPVLRVGIFIPVDLPQQDFRKINITVNSGALADIEKIQFYLTGAEPFNAQQLITSVQPTATQMEVPVSLKLNPGAHFIWVSVQLKPTAALQGNIEMGLS